MFTRIMKLSPSKVFIIYLLILIVLSFFPILIAQHNGAIIISSFNGFEYQSLDEFLSVWHRSYLGTYSLLFTPQLLIPFFIFKVFNPAISNVLIVGLVKFIAGLTIFLFLAKVTSNNIIRIVASLFYLLSIYGQAVTGNSLSGGYLFYAVLPLILYLFINLNKINYVKYYLIYAFSLLFIVDTNFTYIAYLFFFLFIFSVFEFFNKDKTKLLHFFIFAIIFGLVSAFYYLPLFAFNTIYKNNIIATSLAAESVSWKSSNSSIEEILRMMGSLDFYGKTFINYLQFYTKPFFLYFTVKPYIVLSSFFLTIFAIAGLVINNIFPKKNLKISRNNFYLFMFLVFVFFSVGIHPTNPFFPIYKFLTDNFVYFAIFRDPYKSVLFLNLILSVGIVFLYSFLLPKKKLFNTFLLIFLGLLLLTSLSYLRGEVYSKSELIKVPKYVYDFANWNKSNEIIFENKKLLLPNQPFPILKFAIYSGKGSSIFYQILNSTAALGNAQFTPTIDNIQKNAFSANFQQILGFFNIPFAINIKDSDQRIYKGVDPEIISQKIKLDKIKSFGSNNNIEVYKVNPNYVNDVIYIPDRIILSSASANGIFDLNNVFKGQNDNKFIFADRKRLNLPVKNISPNIPKLSVKRISNIEYEISFRNVSSDFLLVFNESFNNSWVLKDSAFSVNSYPFNHFLANGFSNGYIIDSSLINKIQKTDKGEIKMILYFQTQIYFYLGLLISIGTFGLLTIAYLYQKIRKI